MRFRQLSIRYHELVPEGPRLFGDPWLFVFPVPVARPEWRPPVDYWETAAELGVKVEIAGMSEEDFDIVLYQDILVIEGERRWYSSEGRFHLAEIRHGPFRLEVPLASNIDRERVTARYEQGFLQVVLPKAGTQR
ncbi:MAG TPA: Hsp20/alpha crystallin family protein [Myxococcaceae bacterium]|nr:Hsp20/alpha crystallin family protein [Myxococcaceae bacterium]